MEEKREPQRSQTERKKGKESRRSCKGKRKRKPCTVIYEFGPFGPGGALYQPMPAHTMTRYVGGSIATVLGLIGLPLYKKTNKVTVAVSVLSIILGPVFTLDAPPSGMLVMALQPHGMAMQAVGGLTALVGVVGIVGSAAVRKK